MLDGTLPLINSFDKPSPFSKVDTANAMPTNPLRLVESINQNLSHIHNILSLQRVIIFS